MSTAYSVVAMLSSLCRARASYRMICVCMFRGDLLYIANHLRWKTFVICGIEL